ncbi:hypothetical protein TNCV_2790141 [Trichonephila clavipes]|nr:hypothetical protein TNCV_2790141 [Trichonephila clavipes]
MSAKQCKPGILNSVPMGTNVPAKLFLFTSNCPLYVVVDVCFILGCIRKMRGREHTKINTEEYRLITNDDTHLEQKGCTAFHFRQEPISGESSTTFPEDTSIPYSGFKPEPTRLQAKCHNHHTK